MSNLAELTIKLTVHLTEENFLSLKELAKTKNMQISDVVNSAIANENFLSKTVLSGKRFLVLDEDGYTTPISF